ncbi:hypothetical protein ACWGI0_01765 [Streptomyces sp. NPDC054802]
MARPEFSRSVTVLGECVADAFTGPGQSPTWGRAGRRILERVFACT